MAKGKKVTLKKGDTIIALVNDQIYKEKINSIENEIISIPGISFKIGPKAYGLSVSELAERQAGLKPKDDYVLVIWNNQFQWRLVDQIKPHQSLGQLYFLRGISGVAFTEGTIFNSAKDAELKLVFDQGQHQEEDLASDETEEE